MHVILCVQVEKKQPSIHLQTSSVHVCLHAARRSMFSLQLYRDFGCMWVSPSSSKLIFGVTSHLCELALLSLEHVKNKTRNILTIESYIIFSLISSHIIEHVCVDVQVPLKCLVLAPLNCKHILLLEKMKEIHSNNYHTLLSWQSPK